MLAAPILARIREARAMGHRKITLLGGEPTLQPGFLEIIEGTVALGFEEIVIFTNGAKTARPELIDAVRATGGRFTWGWSRDQEREIGWEMTYLFTGTRSATAAYEGISQPRTLGRPVFDAFSGQESSYLLPSRKPSTISWLPELAWRNSEVTAS